MNSLSTSFFAYVSGLLCVCTNSTTWRRLSSSSFCRLSASFSMSTCNSLADAICHRLRSVISSSNCYVCNCNQSLKRLTFLFARFLLPVSGRAAAPLASATGPLLRRIARRSGFGFLNVCSISSIPEVTPAGRRIHASRISRNCKCSQHIQTHHLMPTLIPRLSEIQIMHQRVQIPLPHLCRHNRQIKLAPSLLLNSKRRLALVLLRALAKSLV